MSPNEFNWFLLGVTLTFLFVGQWWAAAAAGVMCAALWWLIRARM